jgi:hypothetical protein
VRVGAHERIGVGASRAVGFVGEDDARQILEIHLMDDAGTGRDDAEISERLLSPPQELVPLAIPIELLLGVDQERRVGAVFIDLDRVIDHQIDRLKRIDAFRGAAEADDCVAHRGQIDDGWNASEVLQQHPAGAEGDLLFGLAAHVPSGERFDVLRLHERIVFVAQQVLEQDAQRHGKALDRRARQFGEDTEP